MLPSLIPHGSIQDPFSDSSTSLLWGCMKIIPYFFCWHNTLNVKSVNKKMLNSTIRIKVLPTHIIIVLLSIIHICFDFIFTLFYYSLIVFINLKSESRGDLQWIIISSTQSANFGILILFDFPLYLHFPKLHMQKLKHVVFPRLSSPWSSLYHKLSQFYTNCSDFKCWITRDCFKSLHIFLIKKQQKQSKESQT